MTDQELAVMKRENEELHRKVLSLNGALAEVAITSARARLGTLEDARVAVIAIYSISHDALGWERNVVFNREGREL